MKRDFESERRLELIRIKKEYQRRRKEIPADFYRQAGDSYIYHDRRSSVEEILTREKIIPLIGKKVLEIGCGIGAWLEDFQGWGAKQENIYGIDLDEERAEVARKKIPGAHIVIGDAARSPWPSGFFDIILQSTVFTSILEQRVRLELAGEMIRLLKPDGVFLWYDFRFNNPYNVNVRGIKSDQIAALFPGFELIFYKMTLLPPLARFLAPRLEFLCEFLNQCTFLKTHYFILMRRKKKQ